jgi:hypothetical protein
MLKLGHSSGIDGHPMSGKMSMLEVYVSICSTYAQLPKSWLLGENQFRFVLISELD